jgi:putative ABC transport system permease protein
MPSLRALVRHRGYSALALATLTLAIGANLVVFTIVNALWLRPRPVADPDRVVWVTGDAGSLGGSESFFFARLGLRRVMESGAFEEVAGQVSMSGSEGAALRPQIVLEPVGHTVETVPVTPEYFKVLGLRITGRDFTADDDRPAMPAVAIISYRLWQDAFHGRADIINSTIPGRPVDVTIIGVAPKGFNGARLGEDTDMWVPPNLVPRVSAAGIDAGSKVTTDFQNSLLALARLRPGVTVAQAEQLIETHRKTAPNYAMGGLVVIPLPHIFGSPEHRTIVVRERTVLQVVMGTAGFVLAGGCATLMALVLVHYERRRHELAVRLALGSSRLRLTRLLAAELALLGVVGCASALLVARWALGALPAFNLPGGIDLTRLDLHIDWRVALAAVLLSLATLFGAFAVPIGRFTRRSLVGDLISSGSTSTAASLRLRRVMLGTHVAATVVVVIAASLFVRSVQYGFARGAGFDVDRTLFVNVTVASPYDMILSGVRTRAASQAMTPQLEAKRRVRNQRLFESLSTLPGVNTFALGGAPLGPDASRWLGQPGTVVVDDRPRKLRFGNAWIGTDYLSALGIPVIAGRALTEADASSDNPRNVLVTASFAQSFWPGQSPLGRQFKQGTSSRAMQVVGVTGDFAYGSMSMGLTRVVLSEFPLDQNAGNIFSAVIRTGDPDALKNAVQAQIAAAVPQSPRVEVLSGRDLVSRDLGRERLGAWFFSGFGLVALMLGVAGVFGLVAYLAESRQREMGVRVALGATPRDLARLIVGSGLRPVVVGSIAGLLGSLWLARFVENLVLGISPLDPISYVGAALLMIAVAVVAGVAGARRLRGLSPLDALRAE